MAEKTYDQYIGNAACTEVGRKAWNKRVRKGDRQHPHTDQLDVLYIGGGNAKHLKFELPATVRIVSNEAGITGGLRLWDAMPDNLFELDWPDPRHPGGTAARRLAPRHPMR